MQWRRLFGPLRLVISLSLIAYLIIEAEPGRIWDSWRMADLRLIGLALILQLVGVILSAAKWQVILRARGRQQPHGWLLGAYLAGQFANNFLPTTVGGDALRIAQLGRRIGSYSEASASVFLERLTGFVALSALANTALLWAYLDQSGTDLVTEPALRWLTILFSLVAVGGMVASLAAPQLLAIFGRWLPAAVQAPLQKIATALGQYFPQGRALLGVLALSFLFQILWIVIHIVCGMALAIEAPLLLYALIAPITDILGLAPIFVNNLGAREVVFTIYLAQVGVEPATAIALAFMIFTVRLVVSTLGGLVILGGGADLRRPDPAEG
ncbi:MAG TPA: lysylphosphatidylglycerol synthase transmembrane domain-containing protein [Roseiflexaceae bacterium]|nr:lysylphosphatidylglycerol synthase transmembrane domain-containing protein [Roseiflexaceae bacterium]HMP41156.1 lysylphosphatidylglycerol synthase transmembrane domain-containing protein [Roseiflexaceae bacterium]